MTALKQAMSGWRLFLLGIVFVVVSPSVAANAKDSRRLQRTARARTVKIQQPTNAVWPTFRKILATKGPESFARETVTELVELTRLGSREVGSYDRPIPNGMKLMLLAEAQRSDVAIEFGSGAVPATLFDEMKAAGWALRKGSPGEGYYVGTTLNLTLDLQGATKRALEKIHASGKTYLIALPENPSTFTVSRALRALMKMRENAARAKK